MVWPRSPQDPWYSNYGMLVATAGVLATGLAYMLLGKPYARGDAPAGDAAQLTAVPAVAKNL
jgi:hypothetical protein